MPEISRFYGIVVSMYRRDHPPPHFHARYAEHQAVIEIESGALLGGRLPARAMRLVRTWLRLHAGELLADWEKAVAGEEVTPIAPLD